MVGLDKEGTVAGKYWVRGIPTTFIIDQEGKEISKTVGARDWTWGEFKDLVK